MSLRGFLRAFRFGKHGKRPSAPTSLADTARDAMHVRGGNQMGGGFSSTDAVSKHVAKGHEDYAKSFEKDD